MCGIVTRFLHEYAIKLNRTHTLTELAKCYAKIPSLINLLIVNKQSTAYILLFIK